MASQDDSKPEGGDSPQAPSAWQLLIEEHRFSLEEEDKAKDTKFRIDTPPQPPSSQGTFGAIKRQVRERRASLMKRKEKTLLGEIEEAIDQVNRGVLHKSNKAAVTEVLKKKGITTKLMKQQKSLHSSVADGFSGKGSDGLKAHVPYQKQGNADMYSEEQISRRKELKCNTQLINAIDSWWFSLPKTTISRGLNFPMYVWLNRKIFFALVPTATDSQFKKTVKVDWLSDTDSGRTQVLGLDQFRAAMFQLADIWCETTDLKEYCSFVEMCHELVVNTGPSYSGSLEDLPQLDLIKEATLPSVAKSPVSGRRKSSSIVDSSTPISTVSTIPGASFLNPVAKPTTKRRKLSVIHRSETEGQLPGAGVIANDDKLPNSARLPKLSTSQNSQANSQGPASYLSPLSGTSVGSPDRMRRRSEGDALGKGQYLPSSQSTTPSDLVGSSSKGGTPSPTSGSRSRLTPLGKDSRASTLLEIPTPRGRRKSQSPTAALRLAGNEATTTSPKPQLSTQSSHPQSQPLEAFEAFMSPISPGLSSSAGPPAVPPLGQPGLPVRQRRLSSSRGLSPPEAATDRSSSGTKIDLIQAVTGELDDEEHDTKKQVALVLLNAIQLSEETEEASLEASFEEFRLKCQLSQEMTQEAPSNPSEADGARFFKAREELILLMKEAAKKRVKRRRELLKSLGADCELEGETTLGLDSPRDKQNSGIQGSSRNSTNPYTTLTQEILEEISKETQLRKEKRAYLRQELFLLKRNRIKSGVEQEVGSTEKWRENRLLLEHKESNNRLRTVVASAEDEEMTAEILLATKMLGHCLNSGDLHIPEGDDTTERLSPALVQRLQSLIEEVSSSYSRMVGDISDSQQQCLENAKTTLQEHHDHECRREQAELQAIQADQTIPESLRADCLAELKTLMKESAIRRMKEVEKLRELEVDAGKSTLQKRSLLDEFKTMAEDELSALEDCERITDVISREILADRESFEPEGDETGACGLIQSERFRNWKELVEHICRRTEHWRLSQIAKGHADDTQRRTDVISFLGKIATQQWNRDVMARSEAMSRRMRLMASIKKMTKSQNFGDIKDPSVHQLIHKKLLLFDQWEQAQTNWITEKNERLSNIHRTGQLKQRQLAARVARLQEVFQILWASSARQTDLSAKLRSAKRNNKRFVGRQATVSPKSVSRDSHQQGLSHHQEGGGYIGGRSNRAHRRDSVSGTIGGAYDAELAVKERQAERDRHAARVRFLRDQERAERERLKAERDRKEAIGLPFDGQPSPSRRRSPRRELSPAARRPSSQSRPVTASSSPQQASRERSRRALEVAEHRAALEAQHVVKTTVERSKYYQARGKVKTLTPQRRQSIQATTLRPFSGSVPQPAAHPPPGPRPRKDSFSVRGAIIPGDQLKLRLEQECAQYQRLDNTRRHSTLSVFGEKQQTFIANSASNLEIYRSSCEGHGVGENLTFSATLCDEPLRFDMSTMNCSGPLNLGSITVILDLILMNPVQSLVLRDMGLENDDVKLLCETLLGHEFISFLDVRNNRNLGVHAGHSIKSLVEKNRRIVRVNLQGSGIPADLSSEITKICEDNGFNKHIGRTEFELLLAEFNSLDTDHDGVVTPSEDISLASSSSRSSTVSPVPPASPQTTTPRLLDQTVSALERVSFESANQQTSTSSGSKTLTKIQDAAFSRIEKLNVVLHAVKESLINKASSSSSITLVHLILLVYPQWTSDRVVKLIKEYLLSPADRNHYLQPYYSMTGHQTSLNKTASKLSLRQSYSSMGAGSSGIPSATHAAAEASKSSNSSAASPIPLQIRDGFTFGVDPADAESGSDHDEMERELEDELLDDIIDGQTFSELKLGPGGLPSLSDSEPDEEMTQQHQEDEHPARSSTTAGGAESAISVLPSMEELHGFIETYGDEDGYLTLEALANGLGMPAGDNTDLAQAFQEYDADRDGKLSVDEFMRFMAA